MKFSRKINPEYKTFTNFLSKKRIREDEIDFEKLRSYRLERVKKELEKNNLEACILFDPVNVRYALDSVNMSVYNMHNLTRYCFVPVNGPNILYEYFNCEILSKHLNLINEMTNSLEALPLPEITENVLEMSGLIDMHRREKGERGQSRVENLEELIGACKNFSADQSELPVLPQFLDQVSLSHISFQKCSGITYTLRLECSLI